MPDVLKTIKISKGREIAILKGIYANKPEALHLSCSTYREKDPSGLGIPIGKGAVEQVIGGSLGWEDYDKIASVLLDEQIVGEKMAEAAKEYQELVRSGQQTLFSDPWMKLLNAFILHPMQEVVFLALRANATTNRDDNPPQPFETP